jgi:alkylation response protein AidB-like acyl-CoA dehydrogenase
MNFELNTEQQLLRDSVDRFVQDNYELDNRIKLVATKHGFSEALWQTMSELGWLALPFAEADGGFGGDQIDTMVIMEQFGKGLVLEPFFASVILGGGVLKRAAGRQQKADLLPGLIDGSRQLTLGYAEEQARFDLHDVTTTARAEGDAFIINGHKSMVANAATASQLIISARTGGGQIDKNGISLFIVDVDDAGISMENFPTVDGLRASEVKFKDVRVSAQNLLGELDNGFEVLNAVANDAILALCAEAIGAMEVLYKDTVEYTQEREQFDHPMSDFQVLQHRMVEMFMETEQCKSLLYRATMEVAQQGLGAERTVHALKHLIGKAGTFVAESAVQLHGGMGMTEELRIGHYFKRILVIDSLFGNADYHLEQFALA